MLVRRTLTATALAAGLLVAGAGVASAQTDPTSPQPGVNAERKERPRAARRAARRAVRGVHGESIVRKDDQWVTITWDRGDVTAVSSNEITLQRPDGVSVTLAITADTKFLGVADADAVRTGDPALVISQQGKATQVAQRKA